MQIDVQLLIEIFGYIGSFLVVFSMLMSSVVKLRIINTIGSVVSGIYALICGAYPLVLMNSCLIIINVYNLYKLLKTEQEHEMIEANKDDALLLYFLKKYQPDIKKHFPDFEIDQDCEKVYVVYCNGNPAGVLLGNLTSDGVLDILVDYSTPMYRDCSVGTFLYSKLSSKGMQKLVFGKKQTQEHVAYMKKMGFIESGDSYVYNLK